MPRTEPSGTTSPERLVERLRWRYATKRFDPSFRIDPDTWSALEESLRLAPSSYGLQPWHFVVVTSPARKAELRAAARGQAQVEECSHLVAFTHRRGLDTGDVERHVARVAEVRGIPRDSLARFQETLEAHVRRPPPFDLDAWSRRQVYLALGMFLTSAAMLGIDACPMEGIEPARFDEILGLEARGYRTVCAAAAGRRAADDKYARLPKVRFEASEVLSHVD